MTRHPPMSRSWLHHPLVLLTLLWLAMAALAWPAGDFPLNDDWVYGLSVKGILAQGHFQLLDWSLAMGLPQAYLGALASLLTDFSFTTLRMTTLALGLAGLWATHGLLRAYGASAQSAALGAASMAANPMYFAMATSFMTDVPFYAFAVSSLYLMVLGFRRQDRWCLLAGVALSCLATLTRQFGLVLPLGFALAFACSRRLSVRTLALALAPLLLNLLLYWLVHQWMEANGRTVTPGESVSRRLVEALANLPTRLSEVARNCTLVLIYCGLFAGPLALVSFGSAWTRGAPLQRRRLGLRLLAWLALVAFIIVNRELFMPATGNVMAAFGIGPLALKDTFFLKIGFPPVPAALQLGWVLATCLSALGTALLLDRLVQAGRATVRQFWNQGVRGLDASAVLVAISAAAFVFLIAVLVPSYFDRYVLFCIPLAMMLVSAPVVEEGQPPSQPHALQAAAWTLVIAAATFSVLAVHDFMTWNRKRWEALSELTEQRKVPPTSIDGGYEFNGWHLYQPGGPRHRQDGKSWWWISDDEYVIASGPIPGYHEIGAYPFKRLLQGAPSKLLILQRSTPPPAATDNPDAPAQRASGAPSSP